ncbi:23S rRNA (uracil(1939)-C(5))-methyltransferase RlmD [Pseudomonas asuensis]|uniref:23S rRNA (uracil(1939)-C(5))-methyltransferase RlmD n=1 Tax=Pseudomonas asuensis TaxID=1825787 RepID=A0ABQ2GFV3_9PSED|nr:23S rRNA (uracil(1939)-C(5))-methyltransferase RlmD [Pseudomonas asuensis]GGL94509.1 23S rRNA (uracil(1939)-C(5))-methyltransferase RlmD [Pseudomonas asuensis]
MRAKGLRFQPSGGSRASSVPVGKKQRLTIERMAHDGRGIAYLDGRTWFVSGALPSETVEARVLSAKSQVVAARVERVLEPSPERRLPSCAMAGRCGGCTLQHVPHDAQLALKQRTLAEQLQRLAGVVPTEWAAPLHGPELGYRRRARIAVRWDTKARRLDVGFRASSSQDIVPLEACGVLVEPLQPIARALPALLAGLEKPQAIGHVELFHGTASAVLVRVTRPLSPCDSEYLRHFCAKQSAQLWWQAEGEPYPDEAGTTLGYRLEPWNLTVAYRPGDFVQVNAPVNEAMVAQALDWLAPGPDEHVLDLFCGLGNFALPLAQRVHAVVGVEGVSVMAERAAENARANGLDNAHFFQADLSKPLIDAPWSGRAFSSVLLDPPRDGAFAVVQQMKQLGAQRVLYVSCNPATLARDAGELVRQGFVPVRAGILDMFPQTAHVEAMVLFVAR